MAENVQLQPSTYRPPSPAQARRPGRPLNTIMEEENEGNEVVQYANDTRQPRDPSSNLKIEAWLSPLSDHFPTPRGFHFLSAPILPSSPSTTSVDEESSPSTSSNPWNNNRSSVMTDVTEFDDLYDISDEDVQPALRRVPSRKSSVRRRPSSRIESTKQTAAGARRALPPLVIPTGRNTPAEDWSTGLKKTLASPVPPTPPTRVEMSPQVLSFMQNQQAQEVPTISAPPSLDGSLSSEQLAQMSAPPTPVIGSDIGKEDEDWSGVRLQPGALATLHALSGDHEGLHEHEHGPAEQFIEIPEEPVPEMRQQPLRIVTNLQLRPQRVAELTPNTHRRSLADLTRLDIPSPGGFFSGLSPRTRNTWHMPSRSPDDVVPPTSTTAEQFYRCPWNADASVPPVPIAPTKFAVIEPAEQFYRDPAPGSPAIVEQVVEFEEVPDEDDMPTARPIIPTVASASSVTLAEPGSPDAEDAPTEIITVYDPEYARKQQEVALSNLDRTEMWLLAQHAYLKPVEIEEAQKDGGNNLDTIPEVAEGDVEYAPEPDAISLPKKKTVRFSEFVAKTNIPRRLPSTLLRQESAYYRAFQDYIIRSSKQDVFVHQLPRFEALQAQRVCLREFHRNQLLGKYQLSVVPQSAKKRLSANVARGDDILIDDPEKLKREKENEAMAQMAISTWHVAAVKMLNGGKLILAPVANRLSRVSRLAPGCDRAARDRVRILDLGGLSTCDWAWHCALQYPNTKIYTVTTKAIRQLSNSNIRGPPNHRQVAVDRLTRLPFGDNQFDLVSARELHSILKFVGENGEDEWETCLRECMRVLKPGGYLEFSLLDSDIMNAGPLGLAKSVEFGFDLKTLGYDPNPTKMFLGRLRRAGFEEVRRAWLCLPMGAHHPSQQTGKPLPSLPVRANPAGEEMGTVTMEAMVTGSTDNIANVTGIVGSWSWERWLLRCEMEKVSGELRLADTVTDGATMRQAGKSVEDVSAIVEEGRSCGAGWRMLSGYARKPKTDTGLISVGFAN